MSVGVCTVKSDAFQCRSDEAEITLISQFHTKQVGITCVFGLGELLLFIVLVGIVTNHLIDNEIVDFLIEDTCTDQTDALEIVIGT